MASTAREQLGAQSRPSPDGLVARAPAPCVSLHILDQEAVLFDETARRAYALNTAATLIWCLLEEGLLPNDMANEFAARAGIGRSEAEARIAAMLREWHGLGLLAGSNAAVATRVTPLPRHDVMPPLDERFALRGRILDLAVSVRLPSAQWRAKLQPFLAPFGDGASADPNADIVLSLAADNDGLVWHGPDGRISPCIAPNRVIPHFKALLVEHALRSSQDAGALHAAAMGRGGRCVVLPGNAGFGKSTLAAGLMAASFEFLGDDTVVLDRAAFSLRPVPFAICTKQGAWAALASRFPSLREQPVHVRADRKRVRYLHPTTPAAADARYDVAAIVFPFWSAEATLSLMPLSRPQALQRLLTGFCPLGPDLSSAEIARLVDWIAARGCFELRYGSLDDAVAAVASLLP